MDVRIASLESVDRPKLLTKNFIKLVSRKVKGRTKARLVEGLIEAVDTTLTARSIAGVISKGRDNGFFCRPLASRIAYLNKLEQARLSGRTSLTSGRSN